MIKLKKLINESAWDRKFGEPLPTFSGVMEKHQNENRNIPPEESVNEAPDHDLFKKLKKVDDQIIKLLMNYTAKADVGAVARSWMMGLHAKLKKAGIKI